MPSCVYIMDKRKKKKTNKKKSKPQELSIGNLRKTEMNCAQCQKQLFGLWKNESFQSCLECSNKKVDVLTMLKSMNRVCEVRVNSQIVENAVIMRTLSNEDTEMEQSKDEENDYIGRNVEKNEKQCVRDSENKNIFPDLKEDKIAQRTRRSLNLRNHADKYIDNCKSNCVSNELIESINEDNLNSNNETYVTGSVENQDSETVSIIKTRRRRSLPNTVLDEFPENKVPIASESIQEDNMSKRPRKTARLRTKLCVENNLNKHVASVQHGYNKRRQSPKHFEESTISKLVKGRKRGKESENMVDDDSSSTGKISKNQPEVLSANKVCDTKDKNINSGESRKRRSSSAFKEIISSESLYEEINENRNLQKTRRTHNDVSSEDKRRDNKNKKKAQTEESVQKETDSEIIPEVKRLKIDMENYHISGIERIKRRSSRANHNTSPNSSGNNKNVVNGSVDSKRRTRASLNTSDKTITEPARCVLLDDVLSSTSQGVEHHSGDEKKQEEFIKESKVKTKKPQPKLVSVKLSTQSKEKQQEIPIRQKEKKPLNGKQKPPIPARTLELLRSTRGMKPVVLVEKMMTVKQKIAQQSASNEKKGNSIGQTKKRTLFNFNKNNDTSSVKSLMVEQVENKHIPVSEKSEKPVRKEGSNIDSKVACDPEQKPTTLRTLGKREYNQSELFKLNGNHVENSGGKRKTKCVKKYQSLGQRNSEMKEEKPGTSGLGKKADKKIEWTPKSFTCEKCEKCFVNVLELKSHELMHTGYFELKLERIDTRGTIRKTEGEIISKDIINYILKSVFAKETDNVCEVYKDEVYDCADLHPNIPEEICDATGNSKYKLKNVYDCADLRPNIPEEICDATGNSKYELKNVQVMLKRIDLREAIAMNKCNEGVIVASSIMNNILKNINDNTGEQFIYTHDKPGNVDFDNYNKTMEVESSVSELEENVNDDHCSQECFGNSHSEGQEIGRVDIDPDCEQTDNQSQKIKHSEHCDKVDDSSEVISNNESEQDKDESNMFESEDTDNINEDAKVHDETNESEDTDNINEDAKVHDETNEIEDTDNINEDANVHDETNESEDTDNINEDANVHDETNSSEDTDNINEDAIDNINEDAKVHDETNESEDTDNINEDANVHDETNSSEDTDNINEDAIDNINEDAKVHDETNESEDTDNINEDANVHDETNSSEDTDNINEDAKVHETNSSENWSHKNTDYDKNVLYNNKNAQRTDENLDCNLLININKFNGEKTHLVSSSVSEIMSNEGTETLPDTSIVSRTEFLEDADTVLTSKDSAEPGTCKMNKEGIEYNKINEMQEVTSDVDTRICEYSGTVSSTRYECNDKMISETDEVDIELAKEKAGNGKSTELQNTTTDEEICSYIGTSKMDKTDSDTSLEVSKDDDDDDDDVDDDNDDDNDNNNDDDCGSGSDDSTAVKNKVHTSESQDSGDKGDIAETNKSVSIYNNDDNNKSGDISIEFSTYSDNNIDEIFSEGKKSTVSEQSESSDSDSDNTTCKNKESSVSKQNIHEQTDDKDCLAAKSENTGFDEPPKQEVQHTHKSLCNTDYDTIDIAAFTHVSANAENRYTVCRQETESTCSETSFSGEQQILTLNDKSSDKSNVLVPQDTDTSIQHDLEVKHFNILHNKNRSETNLCKWRKEELNNFENPCSEFVSDIESKSSAAVKVEDGSSDRTGSDGSESQIFVTVSDNVETTLHNASNNFMQVKSTENNDSEVNSENKTMSENTENDAANESNYKSMEKYLESFIKDFIVRNTERTETNVESSIQNEHENEMEKLIVDVAPTKDTCTTNITSDYIVTEKTSADDSTSTEGKCSSNSSSDYLTTEKTGLYNDSLQNMTGMLFDEICLSSDMERKSQKVNEKESLTQNSFSTTIMSKNQIQLTSTEEINDCTTSAETSGDVYRLSGNKSETASPASYVSDTGTMINCRLSVNDATKLDTQGQFCHKSETDFSTMRKHSISDTQRQSSDRSTQRQSSDMSNTQRQSSDMSSTQRQSSNVSSTQRQSSGMGITLRQSSDMSSTQRQSSDMSSMQRQSSDKIQSALTSSGNHITYSIQKQSYDRREHDSGTSSNYTDSTRRYSGDRWQSESSSDSVRRQSNDRREVDYSTAGASNTYQRSVMDNRRHYTESHESRPYVDPRNNRGNSYGSNWRNPVQNRTHPYQHNTNKRNDRGSYSNWRWPGPNNYSHYRQSNNWR